MKSGEISYESLLHAKTDGLSYGTARKTCPNQKIRTNITAKDKMVLKNQYSLYIDTIGYSGSRHIWTGTTR